MARTAHERVLLIGDAQRHVHDALVQAVPNMHVTSVANFFDGIAELAANPYTAVLAAAEPIERRPEAAVKTLRELAGDGRLILFGHPTLELLSRKMLQFGCDDYIVTPASASEIQQMFGTHPIRLTSEEDSQAPEVQGTATSTGPVLSPVPLADVVLEALLQHPQNAPNAAVTALNEHLSSGMELFYRSPGENPPTSDGRALLSHAVRCDNEEAGTLYLAVPQGEDEQSGRHVLAQFAHLIGKLAGLQDRHNRLQKLAITDELTGVYNARYFRHFLSRIIEKVRTMHFPVTLLLFDIDDFKKYNDEFGHGVGDEILRQTAALMRRCVREHDLVARIGGDEFAVVFWDKEGPRQPKEPKPGIVSRPPQTPRQIYERFRRLIASEDFPVLGQSGKGLLGISAGLAVFPYEAHDVSSLIEEADKALMLGAKKLGKNTLFIVGSDDTDLETSS